MSGGGGGVDVVLVEGGGGYKCGIMSAGVLFIEAFLVARQRATNGVIICPISSRERSDKPKYHGALARIFSLTWGKVQV